MEQILERLVAAEIQLLPAAELTTHFLFERGGFVALVERRNLPSGGIGFGQMGAPGLLCEAGMAHLMQGGGKAWFEAKGWKRDASAEEVAALRQFGADLKACLGG